MFKINPLDEYTAAGNSLVDINSNFSILDTRTCEFELFRPSIQNWITTMSNLSASFNDFYTNISTLSGDFQNSSNLVNALKNVWLTPITLFYPKSFAVVSNYQEILAWLSNNFSNIETKNQMVKVQYLVKSYDHILLDKTKLDHFSIQTLDALSSNYKLKTSDIQQYLIYDNHIKSIAAIISNILKTLKLKLTMINYTDLDILYNTITVTNKTQLKCSLFPDINQDDLLSIWSFLMQYSLLRDRYIVLKTMGIDSIPSNIINKFDIKNVSTSYIGHFCFSFDGIEWNFLPTCDRYYCNDDVCNDCYQPIDINSLYNPNDCKANLQYMLIECEA